MTLTCGNFEWDSEKSKINKEKHGLSFEEILDVFDDPYFFEIFDFQHSDVDEDRYIGVGRRKKAACCCSCLHSKKRKTTHHHCSKCKQQRKEAIL